jgi:hypothetical protein
MVFGDSLVVISQINKD